jgi:hypothetical protein
MLHRINRKQGQQRFGHRRHALARGRGLRTRIAGATANIVENIEQAHIRLLSCRKSATDRTGLGLASPST